MKSTEAHPMEELPASVDGLRRRRRKEEIMASEGLRRRIQGAIHITEAARQFIDGLHEDEDGLLNTGQAADAYALAVGEGSSHSHSDGQQSSGSQSHAPMEQMEARIEITEEPPSMDESQSHAPMEQMEVRIEITEEPPSMDEDGLLKTGQAADAYAFAGECSSHGHGQQSSGSQSHAPMEQMEASSEITEEPPSMVVNGTVPPADQFIKQQQIRWSKYSVRVLVFAITMLVTYLGSASTLFSAGNVVFKICIGTFFIADAVLSTMMPPRIGSALVYLSCFLLLLMSYLLLVSANKYYGYAIFPVPLPIVAALLQHKLLYGQTGQQRTNSQGDQDVDIEAQDVDIEAPGQAHNNKDDEEHFDRIFELSADIVNCGGLTTVVFGNSMAGPLSAVGFLFFYTVALGLYLMMVTTVRTVVLTPHARYLAILLKVLLVITLITALTHGVRRSNASSV